MGILKIYQQIGLLMYINGAIDYRCKCDGIGIHVGLKIPCLFRIEGSTPFTCTKGKLLYLPWVSHRKDGVSSVIEKLNPVGGGQPSFLVAEGVATSKSVPFIISVIMYEHF